LLPIKDNIPTRRFPLVTVALILINIVMFFAFQHAHWSGNGFAIDEKNTVEYAYIPYEFTHLGQQCGERALLDGKPVPIAGGKPVCEGQRATVRIRDPFDPSRSVERTFKVRDVAPKSQPSVWVTILTAMFMHGGLLHIAGNMLFLWIFGNNIEDSMGRLTYIAFYLLGGLAATLLQTAVNTNSTVPNLGASGAIAAVLGGYALLYPRARVATLIFIIFFVTVLELPALVVLGGWFLLQLLDAGAAAGGNAGGVAYFEHIGGFLFGLLTIKLFANRARDDYMEPRLPVC
jgi:membrane associated rhomboid family serine protease